MTLFYAPIIRRNRGPLLPKFDLPGDVQWEVVEHPSVSQMVLGVIKTSRKLTRREIEAHYMSPQAFWPMTDEDKKAIDDQVNDPALDAGDVAAAKAYSDIQAAAQAACEAAHRQSAAMVEAAEREEERLNKQANRIYERAIRRAQAASDRAEDQVTEKIRRKLMAEFMRNRK
jgi:hypothetical protein